MSFDSQSVTRRGFVAGAAMSAAAAGVLANSASAAENVAAESSMGYDGTGAMPWLGEAPVIDDADVEETVDADVLVIGLGAAGVPAVRAAVEAGAKVVAFEACSGFNSVASDMASWAARPRPSGAAARATSTATSSSPST